MVIGQSLLGGLGNQHNAMYIAQVTFQFGPETIDETAIDAIDRWTSALRLNGQVQGREMPLAFDEGAFSTWLMIPAADSLDAVHYNKWVKNAERHLTKNGLRQKSAQIVESPDSAQECTCSGRDALILYTNYLSLESGVRCGDCFGPIPLYTLPPTYDEQYYDLLCWQSDYQACDQLQMNCCTGERFALREMGHIDGSLTKRGREICEKLEAGIRKPVFYYLHRYYGRNARLEKERHCAGCGGEWLLPEPQHRLFDFRCDACRLLSNLARNLN